METNFDVIIIGGSYAGLSAGMALGRSLRSVLIIDDGKPCNKQTPHSHNLITHDGETPAAIALKARQQVAAYNTVQFKQGLATSAKKHDGCFIVTTDDGKSFSAGKLLFATGVKDILPDIPGFSDCWGITVLHCPYCHGYEFKNVSTGIFGNGDEVFEYAKLISNWTKELTIFTNGPAELSNDQSDMLKRNQITVNELPVKQLIHNNGVLKKITFTNGLEQEVKAIYHRPVLKQHCNLPEELGCELNEHGFIQVDNMQQTTVQGVFAAGDNTTMFRSLAVAIADGSKAGAVINKLLVEERFKF
ncbi:NAD(P)/FAD-dependent oxidoreductase [Mucilaginibacter auburnensis]|uniref:Thioredoxin reductase n=1 Tax=Mucilaginibacter auburnensis TaxID=1457233 RepID=A0A2H9VVW8_9SPHI|nr:NAD(P)/FAD-dependent oxidoreductase [Mucilaginibacter auburnensis]PJJ84957.1 thioredoxin reductase [Mucilaginibacter auburnensis]